MSTLQLQSSICPSSLQKHWSERGREGEANSVLEVNCAVVKMGKRNKSFILGSFLFLKQSYHKFVSQVRSSICPCWLQLASDLILVSPCHCNSSPALSFFHLTQVMHHETPLAGCEGARSSSSVSTEQSPLQQKYCQQMNISVRLLSADGRNSAGRVFPAPLGAAAAQGIHRGETSNEIKGVANVSQLSNTANCACLKWTTGYLTIDCCCILTLQLEAASVCTEQG